MFIDFLTTGFARNRNADAIVWKDRVYTYGWLLDQMQVWRERVAQEHVQAGTVTILEANFSPNAVALFLVLLETGCILVPLTASIEATTREFIKIAQGEVSFRFSAEDAVEVVHLGTHADHRLYGELRRRQHPGLVLFSSASTGRSKWAVHDMAGLLERFKVPRRRHRAIIFYLYDHIAGVDTMLYLLSNGGCMVMVERLDPDEVLRTVEQYRVELLPTSPTFMNLILLSEAYKRYDLACLRTVSYGTEPMPESTLRRFHELLPHIRLAQTYGLSELGAAPTKSKSSDSLWVKIEGEGFQTRVVGDILQIKSCSAMLGYLNASSPFTDDGWFVTGDVVIQDGEYIQILGRASEMINVGGRKVYPAEVEGVIQEMANVMDVTVHGEASAITGQVVCARVTLRGGEDRKAFRRRLTKFCLQRLEPYKVPVKVDLTKDMQYGARFKRMRPIAA